jgi:hypothetical protein
VILHNVQIQGKRHWAPAFSPGPPKILKNLLTDSKSYDTI